MFLGLLWCNNSFADLTLWCISDQKIHIKDEKREIQKIKTSYQLLITEDQVHFVGYEILYPGLMRRKTGDELTFEFGNQSVLLEGEVIVYTGLRIHRTDGNATLTQISPYVTIKTEFQCTKDKPKLLF